MRGSKKLSVVTKPNENTIQTQQYRQTDGQTDMFFISIPNKKAQLSLTNPRDAKASQNCFNSACLQRCR